MTESALSFEEFVESRSKALWRSAWLLLGDRQLAEDLVQTALAKSYGKYRTLGSRQYEAYVRKVILNTYISWWRRKWRAEVPSELPHDAGTPPRESEIGLDVATALAKLTKMQRAVVVLRYYEDRSVEQTASMLGISEGSVKTHASRGCAILRESPELANYRRQQ